ncbi:MAG: hypothetical protein K8T89_04990 [Planctomycetes bacterium]|nr:hypothetical protein [Planctomycetota bacterium]
MARFALSLLGGLLLLASGTARAADSPAANTWKMSFPIEGQRLTFLIMLSESDKGWVGDFLGTSVPLRIEPSVDKVVVKDDNVKFDVKFGTNAFGFDGKITKDGKKIQGSFNFAGNLLLVDLVPSKLKNLTDKFNLAKENLDQIDGGQEFFDAVYSVLGQATLKKVKTEDVRTYVDKASKLAENYGSRWQRTVAMKIASALADQEAYAPLALEQARQAERLLGPDDEASVQMQVLEALAQTLKKAKKLDELKPIEARLVKLEARDYAEYAKKNPPFKPEEFKGRKGKSDRVVLVELFTGAECPPCVAVDLAFDAMASTYKPNEVAFLQYHMHIPGPDPLTNKEGLERAEFYGPKIRGTPAIFFNGKKDDAGGGAAKDAKLKYATFREVVEEDLEKPAGAKIQLTASSTGGEISIKAAVSELANAGEKVTLRFVLTEERIRYTGGNGLRYHHNVVRALPGGAKGFPLAKKDSEHTATVNLTKLREDISKYLETFAKEDEFPNPDRPLALKNLRVVAFVQDDATGAVLQAAQVEIAEK